MRSIVLQVKGHKSPLLSGAETLGLRCSADTDRVIHNKCGADSGHKFCVYAFHLHIFSISFQIYLRAH